MSLEYIQGQINKIRAEAENVQSWVSSETTRIDRDVNLSDEGKRHERRSVTDTVATQLSELRTKEERLVDNSIADLERQLYAAGTSATDLIAFRDAQDRAERLEDADVAERLLRRALRTNDRSLANAVFDRALNANWTNVIAVFEQENPESTKVVRDLIKLRKHKDNSFERTVHYAAGSWGIG